MTQPSTQLVFGRDAQGENSYSFTPPTDIFGAALTAGANASFTVPSTHTNWLAFFALPGGSSVWVSVNGTAVVPSTSAFVSGVTFLMTSQLVGSSLKLQAGDVVNVLNSGSASLAFSVNLFQNDGTY